VARYALHRLFASWRGWFIRGLEPVEDSWEASTSPTSVSNLSVPAHLQVFAEQLLGKRGVDLHGLAVLAVTLEDLIHQEEVARLEKAYTMMGLFVNQLLSVEQVDDVLGTYMLIYLSGDNVTIAGADDLHARRTRLYHSSENWRKTIALMSNARNGADMADTANFSAMEQLVKKMMTIYIPFNDDECSNLKDALLKIEDQQPGRVLLSRFYNQSLSGVFDFDEKVEYLRALGALDENELDVPRVITTNYAGSFANCLKPSGFYAVCCRNQCEDIIGQLEQGIRAPTADPSRLSTLLAPLLGSERKLSSTLLRRLDEVAANHGGQVPIHGRQFAHWMHHAFPRECPYPHEAGMMNPQTPDEWMEETGHDSTKASKEEMEDYCVAMNKATVSEEDGSLPPKGAQMEEAEAVLLKELTGDVGSSFSPMRLTDLQRTLTPMFDSLPKNEHGNLGHTVARYALHRLFASWRGWFIRGLEPVEDSWEASTSPTSVSNLSVPAHLQVFAEQLLGKRGVDLHGLAVLAVTLEDLIHQEEVARLEKAYTMMGLFVNQLLSVEQVDDVLGTYMLIYLSGDNVTIAGADDLHARRTRLYHSSENWRKTIALMSNARNGADMADTANFSAMEQLVKKMMTIYIPFNDDECSNLKDALLKIEDQQPGRVLLSRFYNQSLSGVFDFDEKVEYLRALGALDENELDVPRVITTNYAGSFANCLKPSGFYAVCCRNQCEDIIGQLEQGIRAPTADPSRLSTLLAPLLGSERKLSSTLLRRLDEVAANHGGQVPIHGRQFAHWMHHAFPRECPYPHEAGMMNPQTPDEWMEETGHDSTKASKEEMEDYCVTMNRATVSEHQMPEEAAEGLATAGAAAASGPSLSSPSPLRRSRPSPLPPPSRDEAGSTWTQSFIALTLFVSVMALGHSLRASRPKYSSKCCKATAEKWDVDLLDDICC